MSERSEQSKYEEIQKHIFLKCISTRSSLVSSSSSSGSALDEEVSISTVIEYLYKSFSDKFHKEFFEDLRKSLIKIAPNGFVNWPLFKEGSRLWISSLQARKKQDRNNNFQNQATKGNMYRYVSEWHSDELMKDSSSSEESKRIQDGNNVREENSPVRQSSIPFINVVNVSSYSPDSNSTRGSTDRSPDSEIEMGYDVNAAIDLRLRIRKFDEENASLREEILRVEDDNAKLEKQITSLNRKLELLSVKNKNLQKEVDEHKELLSEAEERGKSSKLELQKTLKEKVALQKELESVQKHNESINGLMAQMAQIIQEKKKFKKHYEECKEAYNYKCTECDTLKDTIVDLENSLVSCRGTYENSIQHLSEKNQELLNQNFELQMKNNNSDTKRLSMTPPIGFINSYMHSTPYPAPKISPKRSLYAELKASGFSPECAKNNSKIAELEEELSLCNDELNTFSEQIENFIQGLAVVGQEPYVPTLNLENENSSISKLSNLKEKIAVLMNLVKERVRKNEVDDSKVQRQFSGSIENESLALTESSMTSISSEINREFDKDNGCSSGAEISNGKSSQVQVQENSIIKPIVEALDQIIQDSIDDESKHRELLSTTNKRRGIYTNTRPPTPNPELIIPGESPVSKKNEKSHCVTSKGDAPDKNFNPMSQFISKDMESLSQNAIQPSNILTETLKDEIKRKSFDSTYCITPTLDITSKTIPRRKLSVFQRPFDIESLESQNQLKSLERNKETKENKYSMNDEDKNFLINEEKEKNSNSALNTYRTIINNSESSDSASPDKILSQDENNSEIESERPKIAIILAPSKLILPQKIESEKIEETFSNANDEEMKKNLDIFKNVNVRKQSNKNAENLKDKNLQNGEREKIMQNVENMENKENTEKKIFEDVKINGDLTYYLPFSHASMGKYPIPNSSLFSPVEKIVSSDSDKSFTCFANEEKQTNIKRRIGVSPSVTEGLYCANSDNSGAVVTENEIVKKITPSVVTAMSSAEDSSDSECDRINSKGDRQVAVSDPVDFAKPHEAQHKIPSKIPKQEETKNQIRENVWTHKRSLSDSENGKSRLSECQCHSNEITSNPVQTVGKEQIYPKAFPSFTDDHLQESGIANYTDLQSEFSENLSEDELEKKYTIFSVGLRTDRMTLSRRQTLSQRQRDQAERNMTIEVEKMHQDIQDLAPLCTDSESLERVERVRLQLEMITQCAHRVSCVAETLGAVHQERRISRAALLADRYLQLLKTRCEKLATEINETKRILMENNIVIEEHSSELGDDIPRIRYRAVPTNNRTMMARRRASIAAISRPLGSQQDLKEGIRQRNSVPGRVTLRRPSLNYETQKWETDKLVRTDSSSSIGELREIFEQTESRRSSREENNNIIRNSTNYLISTSYESAESEIWSHPEEDIPQELPPIESLSPQDTKERQNIFSRLKTTTKELLFHPFVWISILLGIYIIYLHYQLSSAKLCVGAPFKWWSLEEIFEPYIQVKSTGKRPI